jgi:hypothetical protein
MRELLTPKITTPLEIAVLCQALPIQQAADLIEQYAATVAAGAKLDAAEQMRDVCLRAIEGPINA